MKTSQGKLAALAFALLLAVVLFAPMRAGQEDALLLKPRELRMSVGDSYTLRCSLSADNTNQRLRFTSSNERVARIDLDGTVYAAGSGEAVIRAEASGGASAETLVKVAGVPLTELNLNVEELSIDKGEYSGLRASFNDDASDSRLRWLSSDESIVRVDPSGRVEGVGGGDAYVSVVASNGMSDTARVHVRVAGTAVHISPNHLTLGVGAHVPLKVSYLPLDCTDSVRRWISSNPNVLAVTADGALEARSPGSAYVTVVTEDGLTSGMEVSVEPAPRELQLDPSRASLERDDTMQMQLMFLEEDGSVETGMPHLVTWSSSDPSVASVDQNGLVTARKSGTCRIEALSDGMTASCRLNVQVTIQTIMLDREEVFLLREETGTPIQLHASYLPTDPDSNTITFTTNNDQVATVTQDGLVQMTGGYGTAIITASAESGARADFTLNVVTQLPGDAESSTGEEAEEPGEEEGGEFPDDGTSEDEFPSDESSDGGFPSDEGSGGGFPSDDASGGGFPVEAFPADEVESIWGEGAVYEGEDMYAGGEAEVTPEPTFTPEPTPTPYVTPMPNVTQEPYNGPKGGPTVDPKAEAVWS